jgi:hypothetical protein
MKVILIGYPGSQVIVPASKYLTEKYLPKELHTIYLNYKGEKSGWANYVASFLRYLTDDHIIFALDDYLISDYLEFAKFSEIFKEMEEDVHCIKLCNSTPEEHAEYPVTTQWTIWNRRHLIELLEHPEISNPWQFEIIGSRIFYGKVLHRPCLNYFTNSSISSRWEGVKIHGMKIEDANMVVSLIPK